ncbi:hypothetical protein DVH24_042134 [Malus domestica]|uniref:Uncharacterized protein n=1 Tax=Malus domestica TaxID=3750 RepID=A0A498J2K8_MALDO|nr:hypothetical protein DVH24_042134 [Malus domestica]
MMQFGAFGAKVSMDWKVHAWNTRFYGPRMQEDAFWSILEHFWAKIGWCKHGDMRMNEFDDSKG